MKKTLLCIVGHFLFLLNSFSQENIFSKEQLQSDLAFLEMKLTEFHPNLYMYASKDEITTSFQVLSNGITDSVSRAEAYSLITSVSDIVKDGHLVFQPDAPTLSQFYTETKLLPIDIYWIEEEAFIVRNYSEQAIELGAKLVSINGVDATSIQQSIFKGMLCDGNNTSYPMWAMNNFMRAFYSFYIGNAAVYELVVKMENGQEEKLWVNGLNYTEISKAREKIYPIYYQTLEEEEGIALKVDAATNAVMLSIKSFENALLRKDYGQKFRTSINAIFASIQELGTENLIVDLRGNQGGEVVNGIYLLKYLMNEAFQPVQSYSIIDKRHFDSPENRNKGVNGFGNKVHVPFENNFTGKLYVLTDGGSFSCSGIVANTLTKSYRATIIGTETGGSAFTLVGAPNKEFTLPNTKIQVSIPRLQYILQDYENVNKTGVLPDVEIQPSISDILNNIDPEFNAAVELIKN